MSFIDYLKQEIVILWSLGIEDIYNVFMYT